ncbi:MAG TPA: hypothetical protein VHP14_10460 [Anaerolineales bacterium]|nr:hypothetical protein [Anaerolineales bacterium]
MNRSKRLVTAIFFFLSILFVGLLFWPFIFNEIIKPISLVVWVLLRIFVLSIDQKYYWAAVIFITSLFLYKQFAPQSDPIVRPGGYQDAQATMGIISYWRNLFMVADRHIQEDEVLKKKLAQLLVSFYATKQHTSADFRLYDALQRGEIPIPEQIHAVLFRQEPQQAGHLFKKLSRSIRNAPQKWIRHWTGQDAVEHYRILDEILCFMEASLEMKNDNGTFNPNQH